MAIYKLATLANLKELDISKPLMIDTETSKLGSQIRLIQLYQDGMDQVLIFDTIDTGVETLWIFLQDFHLVGHNLLYDLGCFKNDIGNTFSMPKQFDDTFYLSRLAYPSWEKFSLDECFYNMLRYDPYEEAGLEKKLLQKSFARLTTKFGDVEGNTGLPVLTTKQYVYAALDVYHLGKLYDRVKHCDKEFNYTLDKRVAEFSVQMQDNGFKICKSGLGKLEIQYKEEFKVLTGKLKGLNSNSWQQVRKAIGTEHSSDGPSLAIIASRERGFEGLKLLQKIDGEYEMVEVEPNYYHTEEKVQLDKDIIAMRHVRMRLSYVERARNSMNAEGRITSQFSPHAITSRVQPNNENISQYPRDMKEIWGFEEGEGRVLVYSDYSQLELRSVCAVVGEHNMYEAYKSGIDLHTKTQVDAGINNLDIPSSTSPRMCAKMVNFLSLYGGGVDSFQKQFVKMTNTFLDAELVRTMMKNWKEVYSDITLWHKNNSAQLQQRNYLGRTVCGRPYHTKSFTEFNNIQIQGTGAEVSKLAWNYLIKFGIVNNEGISGVEIKNTSDVKLVNFVHDSYLIDCPDDEETYKRVSKQLMLCMQFAWFQVVKNSKYPNLDMPCDSAVDRTWHIIEYGEPKYKDDLDGMIMYGKTIEEFKEMLCV